MKPILHTMKLAAATALIACGGLASADDAKESKPVKKSLPTALAATPAESALTMMPQAFASFGAAVCGEYLYVIGGHSSPAHQYDRDGFNSVFWRLNLRDRKSWEMLPGGAPLQSVALVSDGKHVIRIGGMTAKNAPGEDADLHSTTEVAAYDPLIRQWSPLPDLPEVRSSHDAVVIGSKVYVAGGWKLAGDEPTRESDQDAWHNTMLVMDLAAEKKEWTAVEQPFRTRALALAQADGKIYVMGGMTSENRMSNATHLYDTATGEWSKGPDMPGMAFGCSAFHLNGRVYATTFQGALLSHAPGEEAWRSEGTMTFPRFFLRLLAVGDELAAIGGTMRGGHVRNIEWINPAQRGPVITRYTMPAPGTAKVRQGIFFYNNTLYAFGGNNAVKDHQFAPENFINESFKISLAGMNAERIADLPVNRQSFQTFMTGIDDRVAEKFGYAVGGFWHDGTAAVSTDEILRYSIDADVWEPAKLQIPSALTQFGVAEHDGKVYLFGGLNFDPARGKKERFQESETVWFHDPKGEEQSFTALETKLPTKRRAFGGAVMGGKYYIVGGMGKEFEEIDRCDVYDFAKNEWSTIPSPSNVRLSPKLVPLNGKLYLVGGSSPVIVNDETGFARNGSVEEFDPATGKWRTIIQDVGGDLGELQAFAFGNRILLYSVHNHDNEIRLLFIEP